jgi:hypothetical protein
MEDEIETQENTTDGSSLESPSSNSEIQTEDPSNES